MDLQWSDADLAFRDEVRAFLLDPDAALLFSRESTLAGAPGLSPVGIRMVAHAIIRYGTSAQKDYFLPRIRPASLQMAAVEDGGNLVCTADGGRLLDDPAFAH